MGFPFEVPADLTALNADEFAAFRTQVSEYAQTLLGQDDADPAHLIETRDLFASVQTEDTRRTELAAAATAARAELAAGTAPVTPAAPAAPLETAPVAPAAPEVVPAAPAPQAAGGTTTTLDTPPEDTAPATAVMLASSDAPGAGMEIATFADAVALIDRRLGTYSSSTRVNRSARKIGAHTFMVGGRSMTRHGNIAFQRRFPDNLRITDGKDALRVLDFASGERRLPGGSLIASMQAQIAAGKALTAAVGWCAPSETIYDLCELESLDGLLDIPEVQAVRGGFHVPADGGPDFASIFEEIGDEGDVILSEYDVENGAEKVCTEIPCPPFTEVRLDVAYLCLTGSLLQSRGYPEAVARFTRGAMVALAHKVNESVIGRIVAGSGTPVAVPTIAGSDDAASQVLSAVELAIEDIKYRNRMNRAATIEVVLPAWVIAPIRAALARRRGVLAINVSDAEILAAFTTRRAVPRFVYDWQDAFSGQVGGPGGTNPITAFPDSVSFLAYPAGTWVKPVRDVINLDTVYDNALLTQNQYTALFAEDGFNTIQMCPESRLYTVDVDPAGIVGCCDAGS